MIIDQISIRWCIPIILSFFGQLKIVEADYWALIHQPQEHCLRPSNTEDSVYPNFELL